MSRPIIISLRNSELNKIPIVQFIFPYNSDLIALLKANINARWSPSMKCWYLPVKEFDKENFRSLFGKSYQIDETEFEKKISKQNLQKKVVVRKSQFLTKFLAEIEPETNDQLKKFKEWMLSKRYSENTIKVYAECLKTFFRFYANKKISDITNDELVVFNNQYILANGYSATFQNQVVNALKLFYSRIPDSLLRIKELERPRRSHSLPNVLSKAEVASILKSAGINIKHQAMLSLIYSCGLRRGELLNLKLKDVDSNRGLLLIRNAKGKKDRVAPLSQKTIELLREYYIQYRTNTWLFEGIRKGEKYSDRSLEEVIKKYIKLAHINKPVTLHWLRHSYATHLLENGTDLRYIQELLGHKSSKTTEIYTHVSTKQIQKIKSPFDELDL